MKHNWKTWGVLWCLWTVLNVSPLVHCPSAPHARAAESLTAVGTTFGRAQVITWLTPNHFAVSRWDGSLSIFRPPNSKAEFGPVMTQALMTPAMRPVEMIVSISPQVFATSNDEGSLALWQAPVSSAGAISYTQSGVVTYDRSIGIANSGVVVTNGNQKFLAVGHAEGFLTIWHIRNDKIDFLRAIPLRSPDPIKSPFPLWNIRSVIAWKTGLVVTGAEDGDICLVKVPEGIVETRIRYNPTAQRGINSLSTHGDYLLLANCSVGADDRNLWLYKMKDSRITPVDSLNLVKNKALPQVFNFSVQFASANGTPYFFASTQEGLLWLGKISKDKLSVLSNQTIACEGGAALSFQEVPGLLSLAAFDIGLYKFSAEMGN
jgi:WD40 repeat protein